MILFKDLPLARHISIILSVIGLCPSTVAADTCSISKKPQPVGIDFTQTVITAAYAHAIDNVTPLAVVTTTPDEPYSHHIFLLHSEHYKQHNLGRLFGSKEPPETIFQLVLAIGQHYLSKLAIHIPWMNHPAITAIRNSTALDWIGDVLNWIPSVAKPLFGANSNSGTEMTPETIKDVFVNVLQLLKEEALKSHDVNIKFAILSVPDFFNETIKEIVTEACLEVGIETTKPLPRMLMGAWGAKTAPDDRVLVLDQGRYHLWICTYQEVQNYKKPIFQQQLPLDPYASAAIDRQLVARVIGTNKFLREQIKLGANRQQLRAEIGRARLLIKDNLEVLMGKNAEGFHHEEWPLDLRDWWIGNERNAVLLWEDVEAVETEYVERLAESLSTFLTFLRLQRENSTDEESEAQEDIDVTVIMTDYVDGELLRRAINKALGRESKILGGTLIDAMFAAEGAAIAALKRLESWHDMPSYSPFKEGIKHNEL